MDALSFLDDEAFSGYATTFGYNDPQDNGVGAWGDSTNNPYVMGVALPRADLVDLFGDEDEAYRQLIEVTNPDTGASIVAPIIDKGPAKWVVARQGPTIDLTHAANAAIGGTGRTPARWRVLGQKAGAADEFLGGETTGAPEAMSFLDEAAAPSADAFLAEAPRAEVASPLKEGFATPNITFEGEPKLAPVNLGQNDASSDVVQGIRSQIAEKRGEVLALDPKLRRFAPEVAEIDALSNELDVARYGQHQEWWKNWINSVMQGAASEGGLVSSMQGLYGAVSQFAKGTKVGERAEQQEKAAGEMRKAIKEAIPVDDDFATSLTGQILNGLGQLALIPTYVVMPAGVTLTFGQLYQEATDDYRQTREAKGRPVNDTEAHYAALKYLTVAAPLEIFGDRLILGKALKPLVGKLTVGQAARTFSKMAAVGAVQEGGEEFWLNAVAQQFQGYDPGRPLSQQVIESALVGAVVQGLGGAGAQTLAPRQAPAKAEAPAAATVPKGEFKDFSQLPAQAPLAPGPTREAAAAQDITSQPTSDEELDAMAARYEGQTREAILSTKRQGLGVDRQARSEILTSLESQEGWGDIGRTPEDQAAEKKRILSEAFLIADTVGKGFRDLGIPIRADLEAESPAGVAYNDRGEIVFIYNPAGTYSQEAMAEEAGLPKLLLSRVVNGEEIIHGADLIGLRNEWQRQAPNTPFRGFVRAQVSTLLADTQQTISSASPDERKALYQSLVDSYNTYNSDFGEGKKAYEGTGLGLLLELRSRTLRNIDDPQSSVPVGFVAEWMRQTKQLRDQGVTTEHVHGRLYKTLHDWLRLALRRMREFLPGGFTGKYGKEVQRRLERIESILAGSEREQVLPTKPIPLSQEELKTILGTKAIPLEHFDSISASHNEHGGSTINRANGDLAGAPYFSVSIFPDLTTTIQGKDVTPEQISAYADKVAAAGVDLSDPSLSIGTWFDPDSGTTYLDVAATIADRDAAIELAKRYNQKAIFDLATFNTIETGGTGEATGGLPTVPQRIEALRHGEKERQQRRKAVEAVIARAAQAVRAGPGEIPAPRQGAEKETVLGAKQIKFKRSIAQLEKLARDEEASKGWYDNFRASLDNLLGEHASYGPLVSELLAATSPQNSVKGNVTLLMRVLRSFVETGTVPSMLRGHKANVQRAIAGEQLSGPKVAQFSAALFGDQDAMAIDRHVAMLLFDTAKPSPRQIEAAKARIIQIANRLGWTPRDAQAALWAANIKRLGEIPQSYETYLEQERDTLRGIFAKDISGEKRGAQAAERIGERIGARGSVEGGGSEYAFVGAKKAAPIPKVGPTVQRIIRRPLAESVSMKGERTRELHSPIGNLRRFYEGTADIFEKTPGLEYLGKAIRKHIDRRAYYIGRFSNPFRKWANDAKNPKQSLREFHDHREAKETGNAAAAKAIYKAMSPEARTLVDLTDTMFDETGKINQANGLRVFDARINAFRPIGKFAKGDYFPRVIKREVMETLRDPSSNPAAWEKLKREMIGEGIIPATNSDAAMLEYVDGLMRSYRSNDHFGAIELARIMKLPNSAYDFSFEPVRRYIAAWSERMAQVEAFGQKVGSQGKDLFDRAQAQAGDEYTKRYIKKVQDRAYNATWDDGYARMFATLNEVATSLQLANPVSTSKNWISGMTFSAQHFGVGKTLRALADIGGTFREIEDAYERGILKDDLMNIMQDGEQLAAEQRRKTSKLAEVSLKLSGFTGAEMWVRGVSSVASRAILRDAIRANQKNPTSRRSRGYYGYFKRLGIDNIQGLLNEGGTGEITDQYLRAAVNEIQGGYAYDQVPAFMDTPVGRFLFKYQKWGSQQLRHFAREVVAPAVRAISGGALASETVTVQDKNGNLVQMKVPGAVLPLARYLVLLAMAGAGTEWLLEQLFGIPQKSASLAEILSRAKKDKAAALGLLAEKMFGYHLMAGSMGLLGNYLQIGKDFTQRTRWKSPADPPGLDPLKKGLGLAMDLVEQEQITLRNVDDFLRQTVSAYRTGQQFAARVNDVMGTRVRPLLATSRRQDRQWLRAATNRYNEEIGVQARRTSPGRISKSPQAPFRDALKEDLLVGDSKAAAQRINEHFKGMSDDKRKLEWQSLKASIRASQPIKAGYGSEQMRYNFLDWARRNLSRSEVARINDIDMIYRRTAIGLDLMKESQPDEEDMVEALRRIQLKAEK